jgi:hypothetical protein
MKDWHFEHMQKTIVKYVFGLSESEKGSSWKRKQYKKYGGNITNVRRNIDFDIKHGVTGEEVITFLDKIRNDISFTDVRKSAGSGERLDNLQVQLIERPQYTW